MEIDCKSPFSGCRTHDFRSVAYALLRYAVRHHERKTFVGLNWIIFRKSIIMQVSHASSLYEQQVFFKYVTN